MSRGVSYTCSNMVFNLLRALLNFLFPNFLYLNVFKKTCVYIESEMLKLFVRYMVLERTNIKNTI